MVNNYNLTFQQFLQNPSGPYSAYFGRRSDIIKNLNERFDKLIKKFGGFETKIYKDKNDFIFHIKVPSESYEKLFYDTVIRLRPSLDGNLTDFTLMNYEMNVFSNSPAFVFTYAYIFNKDKLFIEFLRSKISDKALTDPPKIKNPFQVYGFEKSLYFALSYIKLNSYHVKSSIQSKCKKLDKSNLRDDIRHSDYILEKYNKYKKRESDKKKETKVVSNKRKTDKKGVELSEDIDKKVRSIENGKKLPKVGKKNKIANEIVDSKKKIIKPKKTTIIDKDKRIKNKNSRKSTLKKKK